jgi:glycosyltransferase involved in cell wall biosynthesis
MMHQVGAYKEPESVSVVLPVFNRRATIQRALDSVFSQTKQPVDVIVIDDGSTDGVAEFIEREYPSVCILQQENKGVSAARNAGIQIAKGNWVALLDSDDAWLPTKLEEQFNALRETGHARVCHTDEIWIRNGVRVNAMKKHRKQGGRIFMRCLALCCISPSSAIIHRTVFEQIGVFDEALPACEDYDFWLRLTAREAVLYVPKMLIHKYGGHSDQLSRKYWGMDRFRISAIEKVLAENILSDEYRVAALEMLKTKSKIMADGAEKRQKSEEYQFYAEKYTRAIACLETGSGSQ